jgi:methylamine dehydrogenase heavy chain
MHVVTRLLVLAAFAGPALGAPLAPETVGRTALPEPQPSWFTMLGRDSSYIFDAADGEMKGLISHSGFSPAIVSLPSRKEAYVVESYYSRGVTGTRSDVLTIVNLADLSTKAEIEIPAKAAALSFRHHIGLLGDERHVVVFNMTPAQSVSIVDVVERKFVGEIAIPGCAIIMPTGARGFLTICGDGTLQLIRLDGSGAEAARVRTKPFFVVEEDPVFDRVVQTRDGWLLVSHEGLVREVSVEGDRIAVGEAWPMLSDEDKTGADDEKGGTSKSKSRSSGSATEESWRPGGFQPFTMHRGSSLLYSLMHKGKVDTQDENGTEIWVFDTERRKRVARLELPVEASNILSSQEPVPRLYVYDKDSKLHIYDGHRLRLLRTIEKPGVNARLLQTLTQYD